MLMERTMGLNKNCCSRTPNQTRVTVSTFEVNRNGLGKTLCNFLLVRCVQQQLLVLSSVVSVFDPLASIYQIPEVHCTCHFG